MKKFAFSLNKVLDYKEQVENSIRNEYSQAAKLVADQETVVQNMNETHRKYCEELEDGKRNGCTIQFIQLYETYLSTLQVKIEEEKDILVLLKEKEEKKRQELIAAKVETSSIEKLKEKKKAQYDKELQKSEEQMIEEFVSNLSASFNHA